MEDNLKMLKDKLCKVPDEILEEIGVGQSDNPDLTLIWGNEDWTDEFCKAEKKYPELKEIYVFFDSANKVFNEVKGYTDEDARLQFAPRKGAEWLQPE
jgi:hypothetical protein